MIIRVIYEVEDDATYHLSGEEIQNQVTRALPGGVVLWRKNPEAAGHYEFVGRAMLRQIGAPEEGDWDDEHWEGDWDDEH